MLQTSAVPRQRSICADCCRPKAEVCNQKAEVDEGAGILPTDFFNDLQCFWSPMVLMFSMSYIQKHFCHDSGQIGNRPGLSL